MSEEFFIFIFEKLLEHFKDEDTTRIRDVIWKVKACDVNIEYVLDESQCLVTFSLTAPGIVPVRIIFGYGEQNEFLEFIDEQHFVPAGCRNCHPNVSYVTTDGTIKSVIQDILTEVRCMRVI